MINNSTSNALLAWSFHASLVDLTYLTQGLMRI